MKNKNPKTVGVLIGFIYKFDEDNLIDDENHLHMSI